MLHRDRGEETGKWNSGTASLNPQPQALVVMVVIMGRIMPVGVREIQGVGSHTLDAAAIETWATKIREQTEEHTERQRAQARATAVGIAQDAQDRLLQEQSVWDTSDNGEMVRTTLRQLFYRA